MRFILTIFLFTILIFGNQKITNPEMGEELLLYKNSWAVIIGINLGEIRYLVAKRMDRSVNDWSLVLQFHTFLDREYPYTN